jgi:cystathionine beta-lyase/cystathionine gamma-synthase
MADKKAVAFPTLAVQGHGGGRSHRPLSESIVRATTYRVGSAAEHRELWRRQGDAFYQRIGNPTVTAAAEAVARLEGAEAALVFSSGMGAISTSLLALLRGGDHVVSQRRIFAQTFTFLDRVARELGVETAFVDPPTPEAFEARLQPNTRLIYAETPSNPELKVVDLAALGAVAKRAGIELLVDSTFASPCLQSPLAHGATLVLHSGSKFLGGHSDVLCGAAAGSRTLIARVREMQYLLGAVLDPQAAWLLLRGMKTIAVRVPRQSESALVIARFLAAAPGIRRVSYPFLESSTDYEIARRQMRAGGGVVSFEVEGGAVAARRFVDALQLISIATSLGGVETIVEVPADLDFEPTAEGPGLVAPGLVRLSVGLEDPHDLLGDLQRGVAALAEGQIFSTQPDSFG